MDTNGREPLDWILEAREARAAGDRGRALASTQAALRMDPRSVEGLVLYSDLLLDTGSDRRLAVRSLETALRLDPTSADAMIRLAMLYRASGMPSRAAKLLAKARESSPRHRYFLAEARNAARGPEPPGGLGFQIRSLVCGLLARMK